MRSCGRLVLAGLGLGLASRARGGELTLHGVAAGRFLEVESRTAWISGGFGRLTEGEGRDAFEALAAGRRAVLPCSRPPGPTPAETAPCTTGSTPGRRASRRSAPRPSSAASGWSRKLSAAKRGWASLLTWSNQGEALRLTARYDRFRNDDRDHVAAPNQESGWAWTVAAFCAPRSWLRIIAAGPHELLRNSDLFVMANYAAASGPDAPLRDHGFGPKGSQRSGRAAGGRHPGDFARPGATGAARARAVGITLCAASERRGSPVSC